MGILDSEKYENFHTLRQNNRKKYMPHFGLIAQLKNKISGIGLTEEVFHGNRAKWLVEKLGITNFLKQNGEYVDVGAGEGHVIEEVVSQMKLKGLPLKKYWGVDNGNTASKGVIERAKDEKKVRIFGTGADYMPFRSGKIDGVSFIFALHHMSQEEQDKALYEATRLLKPDGKIFIAEDIVDDKNQQKTTELHDKLKNVEIGSLLGAEDAYHNYKSTEDWKEYLGKFGLEIVHQNEFHSQPLSDHIPKLLHKFVPKHMQNSVKHGFFVVQPKAL